MDNLLVGLVMLFLLLARFCLILTGKEMSKKEQLIWLVTCMVLELTIMMN